MTDYFGSKTHIQAVLKGGTARGIQFHEASLKFQDKYNKSPKYCELCKEPLEFKLRRNKFCSHSCSAKSSNANRIVSDAHKKRASESLKSLNSKLIKGLNGIYMRANGQVARIRISKNCMMCNQVFDTFTNTTKKYCSCKCCYTSHEGRALRRLAGLKSAGIQAAIRRSKNEIAFAELCKKKFSNVLENSNMFNGWDADVVLLDEKIAVLWNGNWHHKKITKKHSVKQVQNRDKIKLKEITKLEFLPYVINDYGKCNTEFVHEEFEKFIKWLDTRSVL